MSLTVRGTCGIKEGSAAGRTTLPPECPLIELNQSDKITKLYNENGKVTIFFKVLVI